MLCTGCETITYDAQLFDEVASMNSGALPSDYKVVGRFNYEVRAMFTAYDLITLKDPEIVEAMNKSVKVNNGDAVINISIVEETSIVDILISSFVGAVTQGLFKTSIDAFSTRTVAIKGDVVKYKSTSHLIPGAKEVLMAAQQRIEVKELN